MCSCSRLGFERKQWARERPPAPSKLLSTPPLLHFISECVHFDVSMSCAELHPKKSTLKVLLQFQKYVLLLAAWLWTQTMSARETSCIFLTLVNAPPLPLSFWVCVAFDVSMLCAELHLKKKHLETIVKIPKICALARGLALNASNERERDILHIPHSYQRMWRHRHENETCELREGKI